MGIRANRCLLRSLCALLVPFALAGCEQLAVLSPAGPIGSANRTILLDALAIMLAIVVPTIVATLAFAWWFRASNTHARAIAHTSTYSGRIELIVWSIPALVIFFLGGIAWIGVPCARSGPCRSSQGAKPLEVEVVSLDWKWLFIYPAAERRQHQPAGGSGRGAAAFSRSPPRACSMCSSCRSSAARSTAMYGMTTPAQPAGRPPRHLSWGCRRTSAATASPT